MLHNTVLWSQQLAGSVLVHCYTNDLLGASGTINGTAIISMLEPFTPFGFTANLLVRSALNVSDHRYPPVKLSLLGTALRLEFFLFYDTRTLLK